ncbi:MAG: response regulator [Acidobacteriota bacterium]
MTMRVLLVDDEPGVRNYMRLILQKHGCAVVEAEDGVDAYRVIEREGGNFDLLITDVRMPEMDGPSLARQVRTQFPRIPVLFVSGYPAEEHTFASSDLLMKPFRPQTLISRIQQISSPQAGA